MSRRTPAWDIASLHWTPEQALAVFELLDALRDRIWELHRNDIQAALRAQLADHDPRQLRLDHLDPDPPF
jgi:hypothetical protein